MGHGDIDFVIEIIVFHTNCFPMIISVVNLDPWTPDTIIPDKHQGYDYSTNKRNNSDITPFTNDSLLIKFNNMIKELSENQSHHFVYI